VLAVRGHVRSVASVGGRGVTACTTHLVNPLAADRDTTRRQAAEALRFVTSSSPSALRLVAGDLNVTPRDPALDPWYAELREADPGGRDGAQATTDGRSKVDYAFASPHPTSTVTELDAVSVPTSDHHWVAGRFRLLP